MVTARERPSSTAIRQDRFAPGHDPLRRMPLGTEERHAGLGTRGDHAAQQT
jgi:hypothetical protein